MLEDPFVSKNMKNTQKHPDRSDPNEEQQIQHFNAVTDAMKLNASDLKCIYDACLQNLIYAKYIV